LDSYLNSELAKLYPNVGIKLTSFLSRNMTYPATNNPTAYKRFNYVHGLKESTSWGCKNIAHGHYSYLALEVENKEGLLMLEGSDWFNSLDESLNNLHFIWQANQVSDTKHEYITQDRGKFELILLGANTVTTARETTIENLVDWFVDKHKNELLTYNVKKVYMSEGLTKGAVMVIENE
jgi:hypothetical protein